MNIYNRPAPIDKEKKVLITEIEYEYLLRQQRKLPSKYLRKKRFTPIKGEEWKLIPGTKNYEASNQGRIRKCYRDKYNTYFVTLVTSRSKINGFLKQRLNVGEGYTKEIYLHKTVAELFVPRAPYMTGWVAYHLDGNTANNKACNLAWRTRKKANPHEAKLKTIPFISKIDGTIKERRTKLSPGDIKEIGDLLNTGLLTQTAIAARYNVSQAWVSKLKLTGFRFLDGKAIPYPRIPNED